MSCAVADYLSYFRSGAERDELAQMADEMTDSNIAPKQVPKTLPKPSHTSGADSDKIQARLDLYQKGLQLSQESNDSSKIRRYQRAIDILKQMLSDTAASRPIDWDSFPPEITLTAKKPQIQAPLISLEDDFEIPSDELQRLSREVTPAPKPPVATRSAPPPVATRSAPPPPAPRSRPSVPPVTLPPDQITREKVREFLLERQTQYKQAAALAKQNQQSDAMRQHLKCSLNFSKVITALDEGSPISLASMPQAPEGFAPSFLLSISSWPIANKQEMRKVSSSEAPPTRSDSPPPETDPSIPIPATLLEGLTQRLDKYLEGVAKAEQEGNYSKARRMKRVLAQFEEAILACKAGKPYEYSELPAPPGYPPLPPPGARRLPQPAARPPPTQPPAARPPPTQPPAAEPLIEIEDTTANQEEGKLTWESLIAML